MTTTPPSDAAGSWPNRALTFVGVLGAVVLGLVLLVAAWAKAIDPEAFAEQIRSQRLAFALSPAALAAIGIGVEVALGLALLLGIRRLGILVPTAALVLFFLFLTGRTYAASLRGEEPSGESCGCFGNLVQRTPAEAFWQDLLLLVPPLLCAFVGRDRRRGWPWRRTGVAAVAAAGAVAFAVQAPELPLDDLATRLKPGVALADLCAGGAPEQVCLGSLVPELAEGRYLVVLADLEAPQFSAVVPALNRYADRSPAIPLVVLTPTDPARFMAFKFRHGPSFEIRSAPGGLLRSLYRRLPRSFEVRGGRVVETFSGLPTAIEADARTTAGQLAG